MNLKFQVPTTQSAQVLLTKGLVSPTFHITDENLGCISLGSIDRNLEFIFLNDPENAPLLTQPPTGPNWAVKQGEAFDAFRSFGIFNDAPTGTERRFFRVGTYQLIITSQGGWGAENNCIDAVIEPHENGDH